MGGFGRVLRTGLSSLRDRAAARLAALRFNPSRIHLARIKSVNLESIDGNPRHVRVTAAFIGAPDQTVVETWIPKDGAFRVGGAVLPPHQPDRRLR